MIELVAGEVEQLNVTLTPKFVPPIQAALIGHVTRQGRAEGVSWVDYLTLTMIQNGIVVKTLGFSSNTNGSFMGMVPTGLFDLCIKSKRTLSQRVNDVEIVAGNNSVDFGTLLEGDANNDDVINVLDMILVGQAMGAAHGDSNWNDDCDFNRDGIVDENDMALLQANFGQVGQM